MIHNNPTDLDLKEKLAAIEHERWADWQKWVHEMFNKGHFPYMYPRWQKQIETPYAELSDKEKASDMEQVDRYWPLIEAHEKVAIRRVLEELLEDWPDSVSLDRIEQKIKELE